ncbi:MAG TPA: MarR family transcriptional regulator [Candidatus Diapherotrites archaeon]|uniref:MarR family transcriptional regulator n=1 Tax=Candidatus Iainarchaeum sp. TaxID=3101447 RepID=A0A7J4IZB9_9ARCH|nr:MarR family transcriptional regulator [Candidatus Diapherotrites archaeon]
MSLVQLSGADAFTVSQLAEKIGASPSAASRAVKELEQKTG